MKRYTIEISHNGNTKIHRTDDIDTIRKTLRKELGVNTVLRFESKVMVTDNLESREVAPWEY